tara:strand:+ start:4070 stop:5401 length:1332 start_codon:yes stop_codon:yes gene_type:complete
MYNSKASIYEKMTIQSADGSKTADISGGAFIVTYYENLFSPMITAKIVVINTGDAIADKNGKMTSLYNGFPLRGGERVVLKIAGNSKINKEGLDFSKNSADYFYVASITNVLIDSQRETFTLNLVPREAITNETTRVGKKFPASQPISDSVQNIIKDYLKSDKVNLIDKTQNPYGFIGNLKKPFTILTWLSSKGVPESSGKDSSAGYLFYQTKDGFNFRSIDDLISQEPYEEKFVYTPNVVDFQDPRNNFKILDYGTNKNQDLIGKLERGTYCSYRLFFNPLTFNYTNPEKGIFKLSDYQKETKNLGKEIELPPISDNSDKTLGDIPSRYMTAVLDIGTMEKNPFIPKDPNVSENCDPFKIQSQAIMRYNILFTQILEMTIPFNANLRAGSCIECEFPKLDREKRSEPDTEQSGLYIIKELCHQFDTEGSFTKLKLIRDTFGN